MTAPPPPPEKLALWPSVAAVYVSVAANPNALLRAGLVPAVLAGFVQMINLYVGARYGFWVLLLFPLGLVPVTLFGVSWLRFLLREERPPLLQWRQTRHPPFFVALVKLLVTAGGLYLMGLAVLILLPGFARIFSMLVLSLVLLWLVSRLMLRFPATALAESFSFPDSMDATGPYQARVYSLVLLASPPALIVAALLNLAGAALGQSASLAYPLAWLNGFIGLFALAFWLSAAGRVYFALVEDAGEIAETDEDGD